jgi:hypothetical protein
VLSFTAWLVEGYFLHHEIIQFSLHAAANAGKVCGQEWQ